MENKNKLTEKTRTIMIIAIIAGLAFVGIFLFGLNSKKETDNLNQTPNQAFTANPQVILETNLGSITLELDHEKAPVTVANFVSYVDSGFYDGLIFHRVIPGFMIQGGGFTEA